jgi:hypothetical protein
MEAATFAKPGSHVVLYVNRRQSWTPIGETAARRSAFLVELILWRVRGALDRCLGSDVASQSGFNAAVTGGKVILTGATCDTRLIVNAVRAVHAVPGVAGVESQITHIEFRR